LTASLHKLGAGSAAGLYYTNDSARERRPDRRDEYYARAGDGRWWSSGETIVRHDAPIDVQSFRDLCAGVDPRNGKPLVRGAGEGHWAGLDLTLTPGKSVSILWMAGTPEQREFIETAHAQAVDRALRFLGDEGLVAVRQGAGGVEKSQPTDVIAGRFTHFTTREGDPNIHSHCVLMNVAGAPKGSASDRYSFRHLTIEPEELFAWQLVVGAAYRAALAETLSSAGLTPRPAGRGQWELAGVEQALIETFSKRSHQIEDAVGRDASAARKEIAALRTRAAKEDVPTGKDLERRWRDELAQTGVAPWEAACHPQHERSTAPEPLKGVEREQDPFVDPPEIPGEQAVAIAASNLFRHDSVIDRRRLLEGALVEAALQRLGPDQVYAQLAGLEASGALLRLGEEVWTTPAIAACEAAMVRAVDRRQERAWFAPDAVKAALDLAAHLTSEQRDAVINASIADGVSIVEAGAGTGKTTLARAIVDAARASHLNIVGLAPSWVAADELSQSSGIEAVAIARWRYDHDHKGERLLDASTVILVDEAGMVGTRDMSAILTAARDAGAKVVLIGDRRQLESVAGASALKAVADVVRRGAVLDGVRRQNVEWQRAASVVMARGDTEAGLRAYANRDRVEFVAGDDAARDQVIAKWKELRARHGRDVLIITRRNQDSAILNRSVREALRAEGSIAARDVELAAIDREDKRVTLALASGDQIRFGESLPRLGVRNGNRATVERVRQDQNGDFRIALALEDGRRIEGDWREFARERPGGKTFPPRIVHAYAGTAYAAQGRTAAASVVYVAKQTDARELYVALTRHREDAHVVVESERLDAQCRQRQADHRIKPTAIAMRERLFREARQYREKANVGDFCADRAEFARTGRVTPPDPELVTDPTTHAVSAARRLREAMAWLDPSRVVAPIWRLVGAGRAFAHELPPTLRLLIETLSERSHRGRDVVTRDPSYDR
jgi:conjugative relaxase-like TrwC/TraI family protein